MYRIEIFLSSSISNNSFEGIEMRSRLSRVKAHVPSTDFENEVEIRGNWADQQFALEVPDEFLESIFPLRLQTQFPGGSKLSVEAKVFAPKKVELKLVKRNVVIGKLHHDNFTNRAINSSVGCQLSCPGTKKIITGSDVCIECSNSRGATFELCC